MYIYIYINIWNEVLSIVLNGVNHSGYDCCNKSLSVKQSGQNINDEKNYYSTEIISPSMWQCKSAKAIKYMNIVITIFIKELNIAFHSSFAY